MKRFILHLLHVSPLFAASASAAELTEYEAYYGFMGEFPASAATMYSEDSQGVTTDGDRWFFTHAKDNGDPYSDNNALWSIPIHHNLSTVTASHDGVQQLLIGDTPLASEGFWHFGDLSFYRDAEGEGYLVVSVEDPGAHAGIAVFGASDLSYKGHFHTCFLAKTAPWAGVDADGYVYTSAYSSLDVDGWVEIEKFHVDWARLANTGFLAWTHAETIGLLDEHGDPLRIEAVQGGAFSPSGELLYLTAMGDAVGCETTHGGGINVFDVSEGAPFRRLKLSTNGYGGFNFMFDPCETDFGYSTPEEPEGLTVWDFDGPDAPFSMGIEGQLHVIMLDNDGDADEVYFKHYTNRTVVAPPFTEPLGTSQFTVTDGVGAAWGGGDLVIKPGDYDESVTVAKRIRITAPEGPVVIGK